MVCGGLPRQIQLTPLLDSFNDECLAQHEEMLSTLQEEKNTKGRILTKVHLYHQVVSEEKQLEVGLFIPLANPLTPLQGKRE